ncbi:hypothetical protein D3C87_1764540 [compost metagenome]|uniref:hypothetical protein n=1 Tax=Achromobacter sp. Root83 TaxID=1736602 RepID=UPI000709FE70|nr:hypothetical protein [Achromobacter sp. Root83]KRC76373.1 hypothetical protein ASE30_07125 [Achromobacter sp. Root83]
MSEITVGNTYKLKGPKRKPPIEAVVTAVKPHGRGFSVEHLVGKKKLTAGLGKFQGMLVQ